MDVHRAMLLSLPLLFVVGGFELASLDIHSDASSAFVAAKTTAPARSVSRPASAKRRAVTFSRSAHAVDTRPVSPIALLGLGLASLGAPAR